MRNWASFPPSQFLGDWRGMLLILMVIMMLAMVTITCITWENWQRLGGRFPRERGRPCWGGGGPDLSQREVTLVQEYDQSFGSWWWQPWLFETARLRLLTHCKDLKGLWHSWSWSFAKVSHCAIHRMLWSSPPCSSWSSSYAREVWPWLFGELGRGGASCTMVHQTRTSLQTRPTKPRLLKTKKDKQDKQLIYKSVETWA